MILSASEIRERGIVSPFIERTTVLGMSAGLSLAGYDIRSAWEHIFPPSPGRSTAVHFQLGVSLEEFTMPEDVMGFVKDKSSWARQGLSVFNTVIEPGWKGFLTLELVNLGRNFIHVPEGMPIAQVIFQRISGKVQPYTGKYQDAGPVPQPWIPEVAR